jgi:hypothetical protein
MPAAKDIRRVAARRTVWKILRRYIDAMMARFQPPEELIKRVEEKLTPAEVEARAADSDKGA